MGRRARRLASTGRTTGRCPPPDNQDLHQLLGLGDSATARIGLNTALGVFFLITLPLVVRGSPCSRPLGRALLTGVAEMRDRITVLEEQKRAAVSAEATALRRLERDIHDGPQQRLVRLAMDLGRAQQQLATDPEAARATLDEAVGQTRETLDELRALSRGIAPPILADRGPAQRPGRAGRPRRCPGRARWTCRLSTPARLDPVDREHRLLRGRRGADQRGQAQRRHRVPRSSVGSHGGRLTVAVERRRRRRRARRQGARPGRPRRPAARRRRRAGRRSARPAARPRSARSCRDRDARPDVVDTAMRVVIAEDAVLLREGLVRLLEQRARGGRRGRRRRRPGRGGGRAPAGRVDRRRPDAADAHRRGAAGRGRGPPAVPGHAGPGALPVRRGVLRRRPARRRRAAAVGYLLKDRVADVAEFLDALRRVAAGGTVLDPEVVGQLLVRRRARRPAARR